MSDRDIIIALDEGTSNAKAIAIDHLGQVVAKAILPLSLNTPQAGWVEQSGQQLIDTSLTVMRQAISQCGTQRIAAIAISNQRETALAWDRHSGKALAPAITWQCSRSAPFCHQLSSYQHTIRQVTGLPLSPMFSASKMRWLLDAIPDGQARAEAGDICLGTVDAWLLWHLTGGKMFYCDMSNAARTQLLNLHTNDWDQQMLSLFNLPRQALPTIRPSSGYFGETLGLTDIPDGLPILAMIGDSHAALYGHGLGQAGGVKATYGTGSSVMAPIPTAQDKLEQTATTLAWHDGLQAVYGLEGNIPHTGDGVAWMADVTGLKQEAGKQLNALLSELPATVANTQGVYFIPALTGMGAPWWNDSVRGTISGLSRSTERAHLIRAALEAIAYQIADVIEAMRHHSDFHLTTLMTDGGPTQNNWLMQFQADLLGCTVARSNTAELSALGAGLLARKALNNLDHQALRALLPAHDQFLPDATRHSHLQQNWYEWRQAIARLCYPQNELPTYLPMEMM